MASRLRSPLNRRFTTEQVRIVTDSTADIPEELARELGIVVVPLRINFGNQTYRDGIEISKAEFYRRLKNGEQPTTTAVTAAEFEAIYRGLAPAPIVSVHVSSTMSATYGAAVLASRSVTETRVIPFDSHSVTFCTGWLAVVAARAAQSGATVDEVARLVEERIPRLRLVAVLSTLEYARRGGRIGGASAFLGSLLNIKPLITVRDGQVLALEKVRTFGRAVQRLAEIAEEMAPFEYLAVAHAQNEEAALGLTNLLSTRYPREQILTVDLGPTMGTHTGPGVIAFCGVAGAGG